MPARLHVLDLPLLLTGVPAAVQEWLRQAGVPHAPFRIRQAVSHDDQTETGRIVLYDARSVASRQDAALARTAGLKTIDAASLLKISTQPFAADDTLRGRFLYRLKQAVESAGGLWARLADYPFPWQCAACGGTADFLGDATRVTDLFVPLSDAPPVRVSVDDEAAVAVGSPFVRRAAPPSGEDLAATLRRCYLAGQPMSLPVSADVLDDDEPDFVLPPAEPTPLLWRTTHREFADWWRARDRWTVRVRKQGNAFHIAAEGPPTGFAPMLEIWQGGHVATFPLPSGETTIRRDGLAFQENGHRHPAGFTSLSFGQLSDTVCGWRTPQTA